MKPRQHPEFQALQRYINTHQYAEDLAYDRSIAASKKDRHLASLGWESVQLTALILKPVEAATRAFTGMGTGRVSQAQALYNECITIERLLEIKPALSDKDDLMSKLFNSLVRIIGIIGSQICVHGRRDFSFFKTGPSRKLYPLALDALSRILSLIGQQYPEILSNVRNDLGSIEPGELDAIKNKDPMVATRQTQFIDYLLAQLENPGNSLLPNEEENIGNFEMPSFKK